MNEVRELRSRSERNEVRPEPTIDTVATTRLKARSATADRSEKPRQEPVSSSASAPKRKVSSPPGSRRIGSNAGLMTPRTEEKTSEVKRKRKPKKTNYSETATIRLSKEQMDNVRQVQAELERDTGKKYSISELMRSALAGETRDLVKAIGRARDMSSSGADSEAVTEATEELSRVATQLRMIGLNINQISKQVNQQKLRTVDFQETKETVASMAHLLAKIGIQLQTAGYGDGSVAEAVVSGYDTDRRALVKGVLDE